MRLRAIPLAVVACYGLLGFAWAVTNPPFASPDETQHYLRALGVSQGTLIGDPTHYNGPQLTPKETAWRVKLTRSVPVPAGLSPTGIDCEVFKPNITPNCANDVKPNATTIHEQTDVGRYPPFPYLFPAAVVSQPDNAPDANRLGRVVMLCLWLALLACAMAMVWDPAAGALSLVGLIVALTPSAVFVGSILSDSGLELIGSVAFFGALLRLGRPDPPAGPAVWAIAAVGGSTLMLSRTIGPVWLVSELAIAVALLGRAQLGAVLRRSRGAALLTAGALGLALLLCALWQLAYGPHAKVTPIPSFSTLHDGLWQLRGAFDGLFGWFGYDDVHLTGAGIAAWVAMTAFLLGASLYLGDRRERRAIVVALAICFLVPLYLYAAVTNHQGIQTQGRHLLALLVVVPLLSGEVIRRHAAALSARWALVPAVIGSVAAIVQVGAWWTNSHRYAVGADGSWWFLSNPAWSPPLGWTFWAIVVTLTGAGAVVLALASTRSAAAPQARDVPSPA